jgi:DNA-binding PadR family transcriptional regulator
MVEMMLLGFLMGGSKTGYEVKKYMEKSTHYFFNTGFSSIYPKYKKLEREGRVRVSQEIKNGKLNKVYTLTDGGKKAFQEWLAVKPKIGRIRDEALLKVFFFDHLEEKKRTEQLKAYTGELKAHVNELKAIRESLSSHGIEKWKMTTLEFGIRYYEFLNHSFTAMIPRALPGAESQIDGKN